MNKQFLVAIALVISACNAGPTKSSGIKRDSFDTTSTPVTIQVPNTTCYLNIKGNDTVYLKLEKSPNVVTGTLVYKLYQKDANSGRIDGKLIGDTLVADYTFTSEGQQSVRQVAFLIKDSLAVEGYTNMEEKQGKMIFKNIRMLDFSKGTQLKQVACPLE